MTSRCDAGHAEAVQRSGDGAGDVGAVTVLVCVGRIGARLVRLLVALAVHERDVRGEVAAQVRVEVRRDVGMRPVDAGVHDPDEDSLVPALSRVGPVGGGVDHLHVPLPLGEGLNALLGLRHRHAALAEACIARLLHALEQLALRPLPGSGPPDGVVPSRPSIAPWERTVCRKPGLVDRTVARPTLLFSWTIVPPERATAA